MFCSADVCRTCRKKEESRRRQEPEGRGASKASVTENRVDLAVQELGFRMEGESAERPGRKHVSETHRKRRMLAAQQIVAPQTNVRGDRQSESDQLAEKIVSDKRPIQQQLEHPMNERGKEARGSKNKRASSEGRLLAHMQNLEKTETKSGHSGGQVRGRDQPEKQLGIHVEVWPKPLQQGLAPTSGGVQEGLHSLESTQLGPISGRVAVFDVDEGANATKPERDATTLVGAGTVWARLQEATILRNHCATPPCEKVSIPKYWHPTAGIHVA